MSVCTDLLWAAMGLANNIYMYSLHDTHILQGNLPIMEYMYMLIILAIRKNKRVTAVMSALLRLTRVKFSNLTCRAHLTYALIFQPNGMGKEAQRPQIR